LAHALKKIGVAVTEEEETEERKLVAEESLPASSGTPSRLTGLAEILSGYPNLVGKAMKAIHHSQGEEWKQLAKAIRATQYLSSSRYLAQWLKDMK
jgi:hypothetical protein